MNIQSCMGGYACTQRDHCANYHADNRQNPVERLCGHGETGAYIAVNLHKSEKKQEATCQQ